jgi:hypothetical protein
VLKNCPPEHAYQSGRWHINDVLKAGANTEEIMELGEHLLGRAQKRPQKFRVRQLTAAAMVAIRAAIRDVQQGHRPYGWAIVACLPR